MKKFLLTLLLSVCGVVAYAYDAKVDGIYYNFSDTEATVTGLYTGNSNASAYTGEVTIPSEVAYNGTTYSVTSIGSYAFYSCSGLTSVTIPNSVTSIGVNAFYGCTGLTSIKLPESLMIINNQAFADCSGLQSITIPNSVTSLGSHAFIRCTGLKTFTIGDSVTSIESGTLTGCSGLETIKLGSSVNRIEGDAFSYCKALAKIIIPDLKSWSNIVFNGNNANPLSLNSSSKLLINGEEFSGDFIVSEEIKKIPANTFQNSTNLTSVVVPNSVTYIGYGSFYGYNVPHFLESL